MTNGTTNLVLIIAGIALIGYLAWQVTKKAPSAARAGRRARRRRDRSGNGGMNVRVTAPPRYHPDEDRSSEPVHAERAFAMIPADHLRAPDQLAAALAGLTPSVLCTLCLIELKQARADAQPDPEVLPGIVLGTINVDGVLWPAMLCEARHQLDIGAAPSTSLIIAPAGAVPDPVSLRTLGLAAPGMA